jgi:hypothetical protein
LECLLQKVRIFQRSLRSLRTLGISVESCPESEHVLSLRRSCLESPKNSSESLKLNQLMANFVWRGINTPSTLTLSDLTSPSSIPEHSRALFLPLDFQVRFGEGIEGRLKGEQVRVLVSWFHISWAPHSSLSRSLELQASSRLDVARLAPKLVVCPETFVRPLYSSKWP